MKRIIFFAMLGIGAVVAVVAGIRVVSAASEPVDSAWCRQQGGALQSMSGLNLDKQPAYSCRFPASPGRSSACETWDVYYGRCPGYSGVLSITDTTGRLLRDGDLIRRVGDPDIFIIKFGHWPGPNTIGFKRLFLNPAIFAMYGHLGGYRNVREVRDELFNLFETSGLFRNCESGDQKIWATEVTGEDDGILHHVEMTGDQALAEDHRFFERVFCINTREDNFYARSIYPYRRLTDIPLYLRRVCTPRPACLDASPRCLLPEPIEGWCPVPSPTGTSCLAHGEFGRGIPCCPGLESVANPNAPSETHTCVRPGCHYQQVQCFTTPCNPVLVCPSPTPRLSCGHICSSDADCVDTLRCYQPPFSCPPGQYCTQVMPAKICRHPDDFSDVNCRRI
jgi:hypothetical protein